MKSRRVSFLETAHKLFLLNSCNNQITKNQFPISILENHSNISESTRKSNFSSHLNDNLFRTFLLKEVGLVARQSLDQCISNLSLQLCSIAHPGRFAAVFVSFSRIWSRKHSSEDCLVVLVFCDWLFGGKLASSPYSANGESILFWDWFLQTFKVVCKDFVPESHTMLVHKLNYDNVEFNFE